MRGATHRNLPAPPGLQGLRAIRRTSAKPHRAPAPTMAAVGVCSWRLRASFQLALDEPERLGEIFLRHAVADAQTLADLLQRQAVHPVKDQRGVGAGRVLPQAAERLDLLVELRLQQGIAI